MNKFLCACILLLAFSCSEKRKNIVNSVDYESYLTFKEANSTYSIEEDMQFWDGRLKKMPNDEASLIKLAGLHSANFKKTGDVSEMYLSDSIYKSVLTKQKFPSAGVYQALAQNAITQHQFKNARDYAELALQTGERKPASLLVLIDATLELGNYPKAKVLLRQFSNQNSFAHLVRQLKVKDQEGKLDTAILIMEKAFDRIKGNKDLYCWSLSNLGDMYGHAGRIEDAYKAYLSVLQKDPDYDYALKGIAWIALSRDKNYPEAKRIINTLSQRTRMPEAHLMLAEIAEMENNEQEKLMQLGEFVSMVNTPGYKTMYHKYLVEVYAEDLNKAEKSLAIAEEEISNRPTPQSYDLKAWALLKLGRKEEALAVAKRYVENKTFEPDAAYHLGMIYLANGMNEKAEKFLDEAKESSFELGPAVMKEMELALAKI
jgi:tetratricopeptide (TPR) repeat protein